jgi:hypothetical protein
MAARHRMAHVDRARTDDFYLIPLRALYKREGYLTSAMIDAEPNMPSSKSYYWRFRGMTKAYARVGYISPWSDRTPWTPNTRAALGSVQEQMLHKLKELLDREGYLTSDLLKSAPDMPSFHQYLWAFESLRNAYKLIGYTPPRATTTQTRKMQAGRCDPTNEA